jgi:predicted PurR-regulated permease PerM
VESQRGETVEAQSLPQQAGRFAVVPSLAVSAGRGTRALLLIGAACVTGFGVHSSRNVLLPILFGFLFAAAAQPLVNALERRRIPGPLATFVGLVAMLLVFAIASGTFVWGILDLATELPRYQTALVEARGDVARVFAISGLSQVAMIIQRQRIFSLGDADVGPVIDFSIEMIGFTTLAGLVAFFGLLEKASLAKRLAPRRTEAFGYQRILADTQRYLGIKSVTSAMTGALAALVCALAHLPNPALWGAIAFWLNFVPVVGSILAGAPPLIFALATQSPQVALGVFFGYLSINFVIGNYLEPKWQGAAAGISPLAVILSIAIWGGLLGPLGALLAVPLTMVIKIGCYHTQDLAWVARLLGETRAKALGKRRQDYPQDDAEPEEARASLFA